MELAGGNQASIAMGDNKLQGLVLEYRPRSGLVYAKVPARPAILIPLANVKCMVVSEQQTKA